MDHGAALAATLGQAPDDDISAWRVVAALLLCMMLGIGAAFALRARTGRGGGLSLAFLKTPAFRRLQVVETVRLGHQVSLSIVTCDGRELLVATSAHGAELLEHVAQLPKTEAPP